MNIVGTQLKGNEILGSMFDKRWRGRGVRVLFRGRETLQRYKLLTPTSAFCTAIATAALREATSKI